MTGIELVIKIPEEEYKKAIEFGHLEMCGIELAEAVLNGTPLPKGHGKLIAEPTEEEIAETIGGKNDFADCIREAIKTVFANATTIIEADTGEVPSKTEMALGRAKEIKSECNEEIKSERSEEMKNEYEYHMSIPVSGRLDAHVISDTTLTKEEVMQSALESANFGELEDSDITPGIEIDELYFEGEAMESGQNMCDTNPFNDSRFGG